ncbi:hypothetical protein OUZ56_019687 [Daphnia magna]|uniref:Uncharacterized protein n=1 Tax=Daphnia magna TaxID=35525 RepID=A0ABQ9ZCB5_9CRUS|nr:hypothetical protein OUZ56_019687 [Daphnia magna]
MDINSHRYPIKRKQLDKKCRGLTKSTKIAFVTYPQENIALNFPHDRHTYPERKLDRFALESPTRTSTNHCCG